MTRFSNKIKYYRERKNMTQQELAERLETDVRNIRRWENGEAYPNVYVGILISRILEANLMDIFS